VATFLQVLYASDMKYRYHMRTIALREWEWWQESYHAHWWSVKRRQDVLAVKGLNHWLLTLFGFCSASV